MEVVVKPSPHVVTYVIYGFEGTKDWGERDQESILASDASYFKRHT